MDENKETFTILIVDDEKHNLDILDHILSPMYNVLIAKNGNTAIRMATKFLPDLILLDIIMPDISGFDVLTELKNSDITVKIPVIFITGLDSSKDENKGLLLGAVDYITKPFNDYIVKARVKTHLQIVEYIRTIEQLSMTDVLTGINNRRSFDNQINFEWAHAVREQSYVGLLLLDVDNFKKLNDTYGHSQGDIALKTIAGIITQTLKRRTDFAARWGGEEFVALLPDADVNGCMKIAEKIRSNVENTEITLAGGIIINVTISIGVNSISPTKADSIEEFISKTDQALYNAKEAGRNKVMQAM